MKVSILTLGCKVNQAESAFIARKVAERGVTLVELCDRPDYCVINTCTVTAKSDYQSRQLVRRAVKSGAKVIVTGCYAQVNPDEVRRIGGIFGVVANDKKNSIINMIEYCTSSKGLYVGSRSRPCIKVQDGCNNACAYCIVPKARGRSRSAEVSSILRQISELESEGYQEVVLTGIHLGSFGHDFQPRFSLAGLMKRILDETGICRLRLSSVEVNEIDDELIELFSERRICRHIHIPLQSGDDLILKLMRRRYNVRDFMSVVQRLEKKVTGMSVGTDVIVGFPGEGDAEFAHTKQTIGSLPISYMHIFPFSCRPGTPASTMPSQISAAVKKERFETLNALNSSMKDRYMSAQVSKILDIVIEERCPDNTVLGTSSNYVKVRAATDGGLNGSLIHVRITGTEGRVLRGNRIDSP